VNVALDFCVYTAPVGSPQRRLDPRKAAAADIIWARIVIRRLAPSITAANPRLNAVVSLQSAVVSKTTADYRLPAMLIPGQMPYQKA